MVGGAAAVSGLAAEDRIPKRSLGRTGARVSILGFGCGASFLEYGEDKGIAALNHALDLGINYVDTAPSYGDGASEERVGKVLKTRRAEVFLSTKVRDRNADAAMRSIEASLKRLQTDHVELLQIQGLEGDADLTAIGSPDGVLRLFYRLRDEKVAQAIGITSHSDPAVLATALERHDFDCAQTVLNGAQPGFQSAVLPAARRRAIGVIAMKVFGQGKLVGPAAPEMLLRYSLSLPVATAVAGMPKTDHIDANVETARNFKPLTATEMENFSDILMNGYQSELSRFFEGHVDA